MIFLICLIIASILFVILVRKYKADIQKQINDVDGSVFKVASKVLLLPALVILFGLFNPFKITRIETGFVGVKVNLIGDKRGISKYEYKNGWVVYNKWISRLHEFPTYQQHIDYYSQVVITKGGFPATIKPSFNYSLNTGNIGDMFQELRLTVSEIENQWLRTAIVGSVNDVANKWTVDSIFNNREQFEGNIVAECNKRVSKWFTISQLRTNIVPPPAITESIIAKTRAIQEVQVAENQRDVAIADAERKIALARGDSAQAVIAASGEANAIKLKQTSLTSDYLEYMKISKWDGALPQVQTGNGGIIMNLSKNQ